MPSYGFIPSFTTGTVIGRPESPFAIRDRGRLAATRSGYVLSPGRALGLEPRAAGGPVHSFGKLQKASKISVWPSKSLQKFQFLSESFQKFHQVAEIYQRLTDENSD